ncbi:hypothetical protein BGY98DRAFT_998108 [Russula aff. rugulosa BPL654]|nr:hypothetical protein BGY98DRAFT_998108 [Russula aff. rugulosa BPL654]
MADPHTAVALTVARRASTKSKVYQEHAVVYVQDSTLQARRQLYRSCCPPPTLVKSQGFNFERDVLPQEFRVLEEE